MIRLSPLDASFFYIESPLTPQSGSILQVFQAPPSAAKDFTTKLYSYIRTCLVAGPPFNWRLAEGRFSKIAPAWEEVESIDIDDHVRYRRLPAPGGERELGVLVSTLHSAPLVHSRPLWELHVIDGLHDKRFAFLIRSHHAMMDGASAMQRLLPHSDNPRDRRTLPFFSIAAPARPSASQFARFAKLPQTIAAGYRSATEFVKAIGQTVTAVRNSPVPIFPALDAPISLINNPVSTQRRVATQDFELARFRALGKKFGGTVNDVFLAVCSGALRRYLLEFDALPDKSLIASVPVALKRKEGDSAGNKITAILASLATQIADPKARVEAIREEVQKYKSVQHTLPDQTIGLFMSIGLVPLIIDKLKGVRFKEKLMFNLAISNVPGPHNKLYFNGAEMLAMYPVSVIFAGPALNMTLLGYHEGLFLGIVCSDSVPHVQRLAVHAREAFLELEQAYGVREKRAKATPAKTRRAR